MRAVLDDHLLRDWMVGPDPELEAVIGTDEIVTTNLWYARLCKSAARSAGGALLGGWPQAERQALIAGLVALPEAVTVVPMSRLAWEMGVLVANHRGLSTLGAEAVAAARAVDGRLLVSARDAGPGVRRCCAAVGIRHDAVDRS